MSGRSRPYRYIDKNYCRIGNARNAQTHEPSIDVKYYFDRASSGLRFSF